MEHWKSNGSITIKSLNVHDLELALQILLPAGMTPNIILYGLLNEFSTSDEPCFYGLKHDSR